MRDACTRLAMLDPATRARYEDAVVFFYAYLGPSSCPASYEVSW
jgi:hypothetical protein